MHTGGSLPVLRRADGNKIALALEAFSWCLSQGMEKDTPTLYKPNKSVITGSDCGACVKGQWLILGLMNCLGVLPRACRLWLQCTDSRCKIKLHGLLSSSPWHCNQPSSEVATIYNSVTV